MAVYSNHPSGEPRDRGDGTMSRNYPKLGIVPFGEYLIAKDDLDPVYTALVRAELEPVTLRRWMLVYWTFYHAGVASYIADAPSAAEFWDRWRQAALNEFAPTLDGRWPRGHERRHMRGANAVKCWEAMMGRYGEAPERFVDACVPFAAPYPVRESADLAQAAYEAAAPVTCREVMKRVREHFQFGPWIGFKVADMTERVLGTPVDFTNAEVFMFDDPKKAALLLWRLSQGLPANAKPKDEPRVLELVVHYLVTSFSHCLAPPRLDRPIGLQEAETILCKWKSHLNGHYPLHNDITEIRAGLQPWLPHSDTARRFLAAMPS